MKSYLPSIERRIQVRPQKGFGILSYDVDNAYPQRVLEFVRQSPTAKTCWDRRQKFLLGNGFVEPKLGEVLVNEKGLTLAKLLKAICTDKALFPGFGIQVNYNANYKISSVNYVKYEDIRQGDTDVEKTRGKYIIYRDWGHRTWKSIQQGKLQIIDAFNPDPKIIKAQVIEAGGWDKYKGQLFYLTPAIDDYDLCIFDAALEDIETEAGIKVFNNREVTTGFLPSTVLFMNSRREIADEQVETAGTFDGESEEDAQPQQDINGVPEGRSVGPTQLEIDLGRFQGAKNAQKMIVIEYDGDVENKPDFHPYAIQNNDKLFEVTEKSVEARIIKAFSVPKELVASGDKNGLNNSGAEKREAIREFNDNTSGERMEISEALKTIFDNFYINVNPSGDWNISEVTSEGSGPDIIKITPAIQAIIESRVMLKVNKVATLVYLHGFKKEEAEEMIPDDDIVAAAQPSLTKNDKAIEPEETEPITN